MSTYVRVQSVFFFNDTATTEIYTLSLHDALPISDAGGAAAARDHAVPGRARLPRALGVPSGDRARELELHAAPPAPRSEEHTSELQSRQYLVCRLLLEKKTTST